MPLPPAVATGAASLFSFIACSNRIQSVCSKLVCPMKTDLFFLKTGFSLFCLHTVSLSEDVMTPPKATIFQ